MKRNLFRHVCFWRGGRKARLVSLYRHPPEWTHVQIWPSDTRESQGLAIKRLLRRGLRGLSAGPN